MSMIYVILMMIMDSIVRQQCVCWKGMREERMHGETK